MSEIIYGDEQAWPEGVRAWSSGERDRWYVAVPYDSAGERHGHRHVRRTTHAAALGRLLLADWRTRFPDLDITTIVMYEYDTDADGWPAITSDGDLINRPLKASLAVITDSAPVHPEVEEVERAVEKAFLLKRRWLAAQREAMEAAHLAHARLRRTPDKISANSVAEMLDSIASRPTVLKMLRVPEKWADTY
ncbi:hypothetical protein ACIGZH_01555 [Streptomyces sp. NPDC058319]|uniref:hypothetical protein n=1 Tax=unclassified Streptomyces TaxID=2593676 RepID=UPI0036EF82C4